MRYALGIAAAIAAGLAFNVGVLIQKDAVSRAPKGRALMRHLIHSRVWISGLALQFLVGTPLYMLSVGLIGPAIVPGLMAIGLVVLALGAVLVQKERVNPRELAGVTFVVLAVTAFGLTGLSIDVISASMKDPGLLMRSSLFSVVLAAAAVGSSRAAAMIGPKEPKEGAGPAGAGIRGSAPDPASAGADAPESTGGSRAEAVSALHAVRAGIWYSLGNLGLGFVIAGIYRFGRGFFDPVEVLVFLAAAALTAAGNVLGIAATQHALSQGRAAIAIPLQNCISQILPVGIFFLVYKPYTPGTASLFFLGCGVLLLGAGAVLLTARLASREERVTD